MSSEYCPDGQAEVRRLSTKRPRFGTPAGFPDAYAAFVGAEAELARLKSAVARVGHRGTCPVFPCNCWWVELAPLVGEDR